MQIQDLLEHSETIIQLLKQIKIANKTGVDTVPAYLQHVSNYNGRNHIVFYMGTLNKKTEKRWYPFGIRHDNNLAEKLNVTFGIYGNIHQLNLTEIAEIIQKFFQLSTDIQLRNTAFDQKNNLHIFDFFVHLPKLEPWLKWINDDTTRPILRKAAWQQGQKDNYQFQQDSQ